VGENTGDRALELLADMLGAEVIAIDPVRQPAARNRHLLPLRLEQDPLQPGRTPGVGQHAPRPFGINSQPNVPGRVPQ